MSISWSNTLRKGVYEGLRTLWELGKIIFPTTVIVTMMQYTPIMTWLINIFEPIMTWFGLPGEAAIAIVLGKLLGIYATIGAVLPMALSVKEVFIIAIMVSISHNLIVETALTKRMGVNAWSMVTFRIGLSFLSGFLLAYFWHGGSELAQYSMSVGSVAEPGNWLGITIYAVKSGIVGMIQIAIIVIPLMFCIRVIRDLNILNWLSRLMKPLTRFLGLSDQSSLTLVAGLVFGITYGAGVMIQSAKEDGLSKRDIYIISLFLIACHAVIEDTLLFLPLGIPLWPLLLMRIILALMLTWLISQAWRKPAHR